MNILIMGAPGSGKGTFSNRLKDEIKLDHISTGDLFRENISNDTELGREAKSYMDAGHLVPDDLVNRMVLDYLKNKMDPEADGYLLDGYPRTLAQAEAFEEATKGTDLAVDHILYLDVPHEVLSKRILGRRSCPQCGEIYNIYFKAPATENVCDKCGHELTYRSDDNAESLKTRLEYYDRLTQPVIDFYNDRGLVASISADRDFEPIWADIVKELKK